MHIPDGYLSPSTCAALYTAAAPFWVRALRRMQRLLSARTAPLISLVGAFAFVVMMFNLPLPGGTTGHAVGMAVAAIVIGPWASMLAISVALLIQAVFFGDGGITTFGANSFNMAIVGPWVAYGVYHLISGGTQIQSPRRVLAAAAAGYASINIAALCAAVELGIQPMLFHDASGAPLYAPYPLRISVPAMALGHLSLAGLAEMFVTAGLVSWLQKANPTLLEATALRTRETDHPVATPGWRVLRPLWIGLAALMILTPLGLLAAGSAWSEWSANDFRDPAMRQQIATASQDVPPPQSAPVGLKRLGSIWTAPLPDYAPQFLKSEALGYALSAMFGSGVIIFTCIGVGRIARPRASNP